MGLYISYMAVLAYVGTALALLIGRIAKDDADAERGDDW